MAMGETAKRVAVAAVGIPIAVLAVFLGGWALALLLAVIAALAATELMRMASLKGARPLVAVGAGGAAAFVVGAAFHPERGVSSPSYAVVLALVTVAATVAAIWARGVGGQPLLSVSATVTAAVYAGGLLSFGMLLRQLPGVTDRWHGTAILFAPVLLTWTGDTSAYFVGRAIGKRKLIPRVSPGKTMEGSVGALLGATLVGAVYSLVLGRFPGWTLTMAEGALLGLLVAAAAVLGDLVESLLKRDAGVKDSGTLLPGHGGALDRFDSLLFTLPLGYAFFHLFARAGG